MDLEDRIEVSGKCHLKEAIKTMLVAPDQKIVYKIVSRCLTSELFGSSVDFSRVWNNHVISASPVLVFYCRDNIARELSWLLPNRPKQIAVRSPEHFSITFTLYFPNLRVIFTGSLVEMAKKTLQSTRGPCALQAGICSIVHHLLNTWKECTSYN